MKIVKENDQSTVDEEKPEGLTIYNLEDQIFQKLHLCKYLGNLYEAAEDENEHSEEKKKDFRPHLRQFANCKILLG